MRNKRKWKGDTYLWQLAFDSILNDVFIRDSDSLEQM